MKVGQLVLEIEKKLGLEDFRKIDFLAEYISAANDLMKQEQLITLKSITMSLDECMKYANSEAKIESVKPLIACLQKRFKRVNLTDASRWISPRSVANLVCDDIANLLQKHIKTHHASKSAIEYTIPSLKSLSIHLTGEKLSDLHPWMWILGENGYPIDIVSCLTQAAKHNGEFTSSCMVDNKYVPLSEQDKQLVVNHSAFTQEYSRRLVEDISGLTKQHHKALRAAFSVPDYHVTATYQDKGKALLKNNLLLDIKELISPEDWCSLLQSIPKEEAAKLITLEFLQQSLEVISLSRWFEVLNLADKQIIKEFGLGQAADIGELSKQNCFKGESKLDKAKLLAIAENKRLDIHERGTTYSYRLFPFGVADKEKYEIIEIYINFLLDSNYQIHEVSKYMKDKFSSDKSFDAKMRTLNDYRAAGYWQSEFYKVVELGNSWKEGSSKSITVEVGGSSSHV